MSHYTFSISDDRLAADIIRKFWRGPPSDKTKYREGGSCKKETDYCPVIIQIISLCNGHRARADPLREEADGSIAEIRAGWGNRK